MDFVIPSENLMRKPINILGGHTEQGLGKKIWDGELIISFAKMNLKIN
jgi:hypothetical protein